MDKKSILISSVVIALAATMLFATIATPALAAKKTMDMVIPLYMDETDNPNLLLVCVGADRAYVEGKFTIKAWDNGKVTTKLIAKANFYYGEEKIGTGHTGISTITHSGDTIITVSKVTSTCQGEGNVNNFHSVKVTVKGVDKVDFSFE